MPRTKTLCILIDIYFFFSFFLNWQLNKSTGNSWTVYEMLIGNLIGLREFFIHIQGCQVKTGFWKQARRARPPHAERYWNRRNMKSARMRQKARGRKVGIERVLYSVSYSSKIAIKYFYKREGDCIMICYFWWTPLGYKINCNKCQIMHITTLNNFVGKHQWLPFWCWWHFAACG